MLATRVATMLIVTMSGLGVVAGAADASAQDPIRQVQGKT